MSTSSFIIEDKQFTYDENPSDILNIKSVLGQYQVQFLNESDLGALNAILAQNKNNLLLIDQKVYELYKDKIVVDLARVFLAEASESFKTLEGVTRVLEFLKDKEFSKSEKLIVVGGGAIQDVGSFVAACFKRGIAWIYFPTTLLSMCDSCIGAKSSINFYEAKNQLGLFYPPEVIVINLEFLKTLPEADVASGIGEALKLFAIAGGDVLANYPTQVQRGKFVDYQQCQNLISAALNVKKSVIEVDEFDQAYRKALNYGHTVGHALESLSHYQIPHGLAVVIGMLVANELSVEEKALSVADKDLIASYAMELIGAPILTLLADIDFKQILPLLKKDKKVNGQQLTFILLAAPGQIIFKKIMLDELLEHKISVVLQRFLRKIER